MKTNVTFSLELLSDLSGTADLNIYVHYPNEEKDLTHHFRVWRLNGSKWLLTDNSGMREEYKTRKACVKRAKEIFNIA